MQAIKNLFVGKDEFREQVKKVEYLSQTITTLNNEEYVTGRPGIIHRQPLTLRYPMLAHRLNRVNRMSPSVNNEGETTPRR
jgi:hypothetical protein